MTWKDDQARVYQRRIDMIRDHALNFVARLNLIFPESVYMNMLHCPPALPMLTAILFGNANTVLTPPPGNNVSYDYVDAKGDELRSLEDEVVDIITRLLNVIKWEPLHDLLSGAGRIFRAREKVYYKDVFDERSLEQELEYQRDQVLGTNSSSSDSSY
ncbi:hypothetical protein RND81_O263200 [Saponaria officinalis]|uniref:Uncharacterized protein n=1 Tax=Saponaria officinalis TaxID=3572 RepID=A0AAW1GQ63_SAPOF